MTPPCSSRRGYSGFTPPPMGFSQVPPPTPSQPRAQTTFAPLGPQLPCEVLAETKLAAGGSASVTVAALAAAGPRFCNARVYVSGSPEVTGSGAAEPLRARSTLGPCTVLLNLTVLLLGSGSASGELAVIVVVSVPTLDVPTTTRRLTPPW